MTTLCFFVSPYYLRIDYYDRPIRRMVRAGCTDAIKIGCGDNFGVQVADTRWSLSEPNPTL